MKKIVMAGSALCLVMILAASCCNPKEGKGCCDKSADPTCCEKPCGPAKGNDHPCCKQDIYVDQLTSEEKAELKLVEEKWVTFDQLSEKEQKDLIAKRKVFVEKRRAFNDQQAEALRLEREAKKAECDKEWARFDQLSIADQKALLEKIDRPCPHNAHGPMTEPKKPCSEHHK